MSKVRLIDVCDFQGGSQPPKNEWIVKPQDGYIRMLQIRDFTQSRNVDIEYVRYTEKTKLCNNDDILIARYGASIGKILTGLSGAYNVAIMKTIPDVTRLSKRYLMYYLLSDVFQEFIKNVGSRAAQAGFNKEELSALTIPLPPLEIQHQIASTLDKVTHIIDLCNQIIKKLDLLVKSRFVEMFGEPIFNSMNWDCCELGACLESIDNGKSYVCDNNCRTGDNPAILKLSAVTYGIYKPDENKAMIDEDLFDESAEVRDNDLLFTRKNTPELVGMSAYVFSTPPKLMMPDLIFRLNVKASCNKIYLWQLINHDLFRPCIQNIANGSAKSMSNISKERLSKLTIPVPPLDLQQQFAAFVEQTDKSKLAVKQVLEKAETLKKALMQKYFT